MNNVSSQTFFIRAVTSPTLRPFTEPPSVSSCLSCQECTTGPNITDVSYQNWIRKNLLPYFGGKNLSSVDQRAIVFTAGVLCSVGRDTTHRSFSAELLSHWLAPSMPLEPFNSYARNWHFPVLWVFWQSLLHSVEVSLNGRKNICYVNQTFQFCVAHKLAVGALCLIIQIINKHLNYSGDCIYP